ncbi:uncharacterized protein LOC134286160 [Aedes albopictus]|uniref:Retrovirus-related Pol polyprotein from transposon TNT 1-94-like beta-barrel domain-containing protein n=1 Tax=Aedes albopictus TaxID=7160 RepID=A0ABM1YXV4_AEDAL
MDRQDHASEDIGAAFLGGCKKREPKKFAGKFHRCERSGHMKKDCRRDESEDCKNYSVTNRKAVTFTATRAESSSDTGSIRFCVDSGSSNHFINDINYLKDMRKLKEPIFVDVAKDGALLKGDYIGEFTGLSKRGVEFRMKNVIVVPELRMNLLPVRKLAQTGIDLLFSGRRAQFKLNDEVIGEAHMRASSYELKIRAVEANNRRQHRPQIRRNFEKQKRPTDPEGEAGIPKILRERDIEDSREQSVEEINELDQLERWKKEETPKALPSQKKRDDCLESNTRRSERSACL